MRWVLHSPFASFILLFAFLYGAFGVHSPFFPSFLSTRGLEPETVGVLLAAGTAIRLVTAPLAGLLADRLGAGRAVLALSLSAAYLAALAYLPAHGFWQLLVVTLVAAIALAPLAPLADALALRAGQGHHASPPTFDYGQVRGAGSAAFVMGSLVAGLAIAKTGLASILFLQAGLFALATLFCIRVPQTRWASPESELGTRTYSSHSAEAIRRLIGIVLYRRIILVAALVF